MVPQSPFGLFLLILIVRTSSSEKGSLVYVVDTTGSMADDIAQVRTSTKNITKTVFEEKASQIKNMIIVKFNDPYAMLDVITDNRYVYESKLNKLSIKEYSGGDCPEMSMKGLSIALDNSLPGSFIYLFTDASAKDHYKGAEIIKKCQEKKSQIVFVITGHCTRYYGSPAFQVYSEIAASCSGLLIDVQKHEVSKIFNPIRDAIRDAKEVITSVSIPANSRQDISFEINEETEYATVTVAGDNVELTIYGPSTTPTKWKQSEKLTWLKNFKVMKLTDLIPGTYTANVWSASVTTIKIVAKSDFSFQYGFSEVQTTNVKNTIAQPIANSSTHLIVSVSDPHNSVNILSAQILDINENIINGNLPLKQINKNLYTTASFITPLKTFKVAVLGNAINTGKSIRHLGRFPITPQPKKERPVITISEGTSVKVEYGQPLKLTCKVTAFPKPKIQWTNGYKVISSDTVVLEPPYEYASYLTIPEANESQTYYCVADNELGNDKREIEVNLKDLFEFNSPPKDALEISYGEKGTLICDITSTQPMYITWIFQEKNSSYKRQIETSDKYSVSSDGTVLTIKKMSPDQTGTYTCTGILKRDSDKFISHRTQVKLVGFTIPKIISDASKIYKSIEGRDKILSIPCTATGMPKPTTSWTVRGTTIRPSRKYSVEDGFLVISGLTVDDTGTYECQAANAAGVSRASFHAEILQVPQVSGEIVKKVRVGTSVNIICNVIKGVPSPRIIWQFKAKEESKYVEIANASNELRISKVDKEDAGHYKCIAHNDVGDAEHITELVVQSLPKIISDASKIYRSIEGRDKILKIPCTATGIPKPTTSWTVRGTTIRPSSKYSEEYGFLVISDPTVDDTATYECEAANAAGVSRGSFLAEILQAPLLSGEIIKRVRVGTSVNIICNVIKGVPLPTITWQFRAKGESKYVKVISVGIELRISKVHEQDAGHYKCIAHNEVGDVEHITELEAQFVPYITTNRSVKYEGVEGDVALKIPCDARGVPAPVISWLCNGTVIKTEETRYSILSEGALIIKDPKREDTASYTCVATNSIGSGQAVFEAEVKQYVDDYGPIDEVFIDVRKHNSYRLECGSPGQSVKWFTENLGEANVTGNYYEININGAFASNFTCRVSDKDGAYMKTFVVLANEPPKFEIQTIETIFDWSGDDDKLDCTITDEYNTHVEWLYNGKPINDHKSLTMSVGARWGNYTCKVSNPFGTVQRSFNVTSTQCIISRNLQNHDAMPLILNEKSTWPRLSGNKDYFKIEPGTSLTFACPNSKFDGNKFKKFPTSNQITAVCDKQDTFMVGGKPYKSADLECDRPVIPTVIKEKVQCAEGPTERLLVGYNTSTSNFLETYQVCFDTSKNLPVYSFESMPNSNNEGDVAYNWYEHPAVEFKPNVDSYTCENSTSTCCYIKAQMISNRAFSDSVAQTSTFIDPINAVPVWIPCDEYQSPWSLIEKNVRKKLTRTPVSALWSGTHMGEKQNILDAPRYLFKLMEFGNKKSIAIVYINGPTPTDKDVLCENTLSNRDLSGLRVLSGHVYWCDGEEFRRVFNFNHH